MDDLENKYKNLGNFQANGMYKGAAGFKNSSELRGKVDELMNDEDLKEVINDTHFFIN